MFDWLKKREPESTPPREVTRREVFGGRQVVPVKKCPRCKTFFNNTTYTYCPDDSTELVVPDELPPRSWFTEIRKVNQRYCPTCSATFRPHKVKCSADGTELKFLGEDEVETPIVAQRYRLHAPIGQEKVFDSFLARDTQAADPGDDLVLVNFLNSDLRRDPKTVSRFLKLSKTAIGLAHPNLVAIHEVNVTADGSPYMVSDFVPYGRTFEYELWKRGCMGEAHTIHAFVDILDALAYAHECGITHGAISMSNLIVKRQNESRPKGYLANFGVAERVLRQLDWDGPSTETRTSGLYGDATGICPEFCQGARANSASDIYQIGCTLYEALTAKKPFERDNVTALFIAHMKDEPDDIRVWGPEISELVSTVVKRCLKKEPAERPTAAELVSVLRAYDREIV